MTITTAPQAPSPPSPPTAMPDSASLSATVVDVTGGTVLAAEPSRPTRTNVRSSQKKKGGEPNSTESLSRSEPAAAGTPTKKKTRLELLERELASPLAAYAPVREIPVARAIAVHLGNV